MAGLFLLCINPGWTQGGGNINMLLNCVMCLSPLVLLFRGARIWIPFVDVPLLVFLAALIGMPAIFHPASIRLSTMGFTCAYCVYLMMLARLLKMSNCGAAGFSRFCRVVVWCFLAVLIIQQICVLFHWPVFMEAMRYDNEWKLNSLTAEPSHTTFTLCAVMYYYAWTQSRVECLSLSRSLRSHPWVWIAFAWIIFSTANASAFLFGPLTLLPYLRPRNFCGYVCVGFFALLIFMILPTQRNGQIDRLRQLVVAVPTFNDSAVIRADESASARIVPTFRGARLVTTLSPETIVGHGVDADRTATDPKPCDRNGYGSAGVFSVWYNYGIIAALALWIAIGSTTLVGNSWISIIPFLLAFQFSETYNMQLMWLVMALGTTFKLRVLNNVSGKKGYHKFNIRRVAVIGSQGVPPQYGGFETLVDNIIENRSENVSYTVFCSRPDMGTSLSEYNGCELRYVNLRAHGVMSVAYDIVSLCRAARGYEAVLVLGVSGCIFLPVFRLLSRAKVIVNIDGLEHKRDKWRPLAKRFLEFSLGTCIRWAHEIISDNKGIQDFVREVYGRKARLVAYGGDHTLREISEERQLSMLAYYGIEKGDYDLSICRIEPENNCHITLEAYAATDRNLVFVGNWNHSDYSRGLYERYKSYANIRLIRAVYDPDVLYTLRNNARRYIHGHRAGGTNPSLVEAMFFKMPILTFDVIYNRETTHNRAYYYTTTDELARLIKMPGLDGSGTLEVARTHYRWTTIARMYEDLY